MNVYRYIKRPHSLTGAHTIKLQTKLKKIQAITIATQSRADKVLYREIENSKNTLFLLILFMLTTPTEATMRHLPTQVGR